MYWFVHLATITELNGWDAMNPGHFDQHLAPFYERELADKTLTREQAKELLSCFWIKSITIQRRRRSESPLVRAEHTMISPTSTSAELHQKAAMLLMRSRT